MHSSSADCVLGEARLISSPSTRLAKIGPGLNSNSRSSWLKALTPVMSLGSRSGVNWTRRTEQSIDRASALASSVLPTPGTSSISTCPSASSTVRASLTACGLPAMTLSTAALIRLATPTRSLSCGSACPVSTATCPPRVGCGAIAGPAARHVHALRQYDAAGLLRSRGDTDAVTKSHLIMP